MVSLIKEKDNLLTKHPFGCIFLFCVFIYILTGGTISFMGPFKYALLTALLAIFPAYYLIKTVDKSPLFLLLTIPVGALGGFVCNSVKVPQLAILAIGCFMVLMVFISLLVFKKLDWERALVLICFLAILFRLFRILTSSVSGADQHDVSYFKFNMNEACHDNYILWIYKYWAIPSFDVRLNGQFYHPPLHYFLCAVLLKINELVFPGLRENYECLQILPLLYSSCSFILMIRIMKLLDIKGRALFFGSMIIAFYPGLFYLSGSINNDMLSALFSVLSIYMALCWYQNRNYKNIILTALSIGLGMSSKLSCGIVAFPVAFIFLMALIKEKKRGNLVLQFLSFGVLVFPLGLWFPVRNYILHKVPFTFIHDIGRPADMDVSSFGLISRLFDFTGYSTSVPYMVYSADIKEYNIFVALLKTSLFDDLQLTHNGFFLGLGTALFLMGIFFWILMLVLAVYNVISMIRKKNISWEVVSVYILAMALLISIISMAMKYPVICSTNFRYIAPLLLSTISIYGICHMDLYKVKYGKKITVALDTVISLFSVMEIIFITTFWMA